MPTPQDTPGAMEQAIDRIFGPDPDGKARRFLTEGAIRCAAREQDAIKADLLAALEAIRDGAREAVAESTATDDDTCELTTMLDCIRHDAEAAIERARGGQR